MLHECNFVTLNLRLVFGRIAIGYDEGTTMIKLGAEEPVASMDNSDEIIWVKHDEF